MKSIFYIFLFFLLIHPWQLINAQETEVENEGVTYRIETTGTLSSSSTTPFWMVSNRYGKVPLDHNNIYLNAGIFQDQHFGKGFYWGAGLDVIATTSRYRNFYVQQLYGEIGYKSLLLSIGSKERYTSLWDQSLSSGDMVFSNNARPIPEINLRIPEFTIVPYTKGWMQVKGDFAVGKSFDTKYLEHFVTDGKTYVTNVLWHHKSIHLQMKDTHNDFPFSFILGVQHWAQWGGTSTNELIGKQPQSLKDFIRIVFFKEGGSEATTSDQINVLGNHYGSYDFKFTYQKEDWSASFYHQRYFDDKSGVTFVNQWDGLWGVEAVLHKTPWIKKIIFEHLETRHQSGAFHFIGFDHDKHYGVGGGNDNYYNNGEYINGVSYFNRSLGSPLLKSPEYNEDGSLGFKCNRVSNWHLGIQGKISSYVNYRFLFTVMNNWGTHYKPYLTKKTGTSGLIEISYQPPRLKGWTFTGAVANNSGTVFDNGIGFSLSIVKRGILKDHNLFKFIP